MSNRIYYIFGIFFIALAINTAGIYYYPNYEFLNFRGSLRYFFILFLLVAFVVATFFFALYQFFSNVKSISLRYKSMLNIVCTLLSAIISALYNFIARQEVINLVNRASNLDELSIVNYGFGFFYSCVVLYIISYFILLTPTSVILFFLMRSKIGKEN